ncbi:MAG: Cna B-type domain-containing protein [Kurthia sp.]|nr:Cna B-type domain-containing protein [Candidatus Kurthia equi]
MKNLFVEAGEKNDWAYVFDNLPKVDAENNPYDYQVNIVKISKYLVFVDGMIITLTLAAGSGINELPDPPIEKVMREKLIISVDEKEDKPKTTSSKEKPKTTYTNKATNIKTNEEVAPQVNKRESLPQTSANSGFLFEFLGALFCCLGVGLCVRTIKFQQQS